VFRRVSECPDRHGGHAGSCSPPQPSSRHPVPIRRPGGAASRQDSEGSSTMEIALANSAPVTSTRARVGSVKDGRRCPQPLQTRRSPGRLAPRRGGGAPTIVGRLPVWSPRPVRLLSTALAVAVETSVTPATPRPRDRPLPASVAEATDARFGAVVVTTFGASYSNCTPTTKPAAAASEVPRPWYPRRREACARCHRPARHHRRRRR